MRPAGAADRAAKGRQVSAVSGLLHHGIEAGFWSFLSTKNIVLKFGQISS